MKKYFFVALAATALASCSSDEVVELNEGNEIKFTAIADNDSRAATVYCNNNKMSKFTVYASAGTKDFISGEVYTNQDGTYTTDKKRYWPESDALNFYAFENCTGTFNWTAGQVPTVTGFSPAEQVSKQVDFVYAVEPNAKKTQTGVLALNFRHALSMIEFQAKCENPDLEIEILDVKVGNALGTADFTFPAGTTQNVVEDHSQTNLGTAPTNVGTWSQWTLAGANNKDFTFTTSVGDDIVNDLTASSIVVNSTNSKTAPVSLSVSIGNDAEGGSYTRNNKQSMLLLPQKTKAWAADPVAQDSREGTYLAVKCRIWNVCGEDKVLLYGDADKDVEGYEGRWASVPVAFDWEGGKRYVYTFNFTNGGNAGYEDNSEGDPKETPVLLPLTLSVTVDDFQTVTDLADGEGDTDPSHNENMETK